jgi:hypothetical protein
MIRPQKRNKKKKKPIKTPETTTPSAIINIPLTTGKCGNWIYLRFVGDQVEKDKCNMRYFIIGVIITS